MLIKENIALKQRKESLERKESILSFSIAMITPTGRFWWEGTREIKCSFSVCLLTPTQGDSAKNLEFPLPRLLGAVESDFSHCPLCK